MSFSTQLPTATCAAPLARGFTLPLPLGPCRPTRVIQRRRRHPFQPRHTPGPYQFPKSIEAQLARDLEPFRNAEAAFALALFLGRFHSSPTRLGRPFAIDRRELAGHQELELSENRIRGAIKTLENIGFLNRLPGIGARYKATENGGLHRKPIQFEFGEQFRSQFQDAHNRAQKLRGRRLRDPRPIPVAPMKLPPVPVPVTRSTKPPKWNPSRKDLYLGDSKNLPEKAGASVAPNPNLEAALERLRKAIQE